ncbi:unnamed protein product [Wuchereria bancrofti]|uniref:Uncharacterized protein n=1 Tax=Wuchereria bancrofti TaxID=6293 RepID=A0A3P7DI49_WUCBA|nr:unnamed protein product [Wuchereria bancrofti]
MHFTHYGTCKVLKCKELKLFPCVPMYSEVWINNKDCRLINEWVDEDKGKWEKCHHIYPSFILFSFITPRRSAGDIVRFRPASLRFASTHKCTKHSELLLLKFIWHSADFSFTKISFYLLEFQSVTIIMYCPSGEISRDTLSFLIQKLDRLRSSASTVFEVDQMKDAGELIVSNDSSANFSYDYYEVSTFFNLTNHNC